MRSFGMTQSVLALAAALAVAAPASAASYNFVVDYSGNNVATLAAGSDNPLATTLLAGDSFTYTLQATGAGQWTAVSAGDIFPLFALYLAEDGERTGNFTLNLLNDATSVFSHAETGAYNAFTHVGTNELSLPVGLTFDTFQLSYTLLSATAPSTPLSLLPNCPWCTEGAAGPEFNDGSSQGLNGRLAFSAAPVPEPSTFALMLAGLGIAGVAARRRAHKQA